LIADVVTQITWYWITFKESC